MCVNPNHNDQAMQHRTRVLGRWAFHLMPLKSEICFRINSAQLCCYYADYAAIMPIMPPVNIPFFIPGVLFKKCNKNDYD